MGSQMNIPLFRVYLFSPKRESHTIVCDKGCVTVISADVVRSWSAQHCYSYSPSGNHSALPPLIFSRLDTMYQESIFAYGQKKANNLQITEQSRLKNSGSGLRKRLWGHRITGQLSRAHVNRWKPDISSNAFIQWNKFAHQPSVTTPRLWRSRKGWF